MAAYTDMLDDGLKLLTEGLKFISTLDFSLVVGLLSTKEVYNASSSTSLPHNLSSLRALSLSHSHFIPPRRGLTRCSLSTTLPHYLELSFNKHRHNRHSPILNFWSDLYPVTFHSNQNNF